MSNAALEAMQVDPSNCDQAQAWNGDEGAYWAAHAETFERSLAGYDRRFYEAAAIGPAERVLDIGCGTGQTTLNAARLAPFGEAVGIDLSSPMISVARRRAGRAGVTNVRYEHGDAQIHRFERGRFDIAISRTGAMFFGDAVAAFRNIGNALGDAGRLTLLAWQPFEQNEWICEFVAALGAGLLAPPPAGAPGPFGLSDPEHVQTTLAEGGFTDIRLQSATSPMWFGNDVEEAAAFLTGLMGWMIAGFDDAARSAALDRLRTTLTAHQTDAGVMYGSAAWIITAQRA